jgi:hypothetical protein
VTADADRPADVREPARPAFGVAELTDLERRMQGILDPDDAIEAVFVALEWLAHALPSAGLTVVPAGEQREEWAVAYGVVVDGELAEAGTLGYDDEASAAEMVQWMHDAWLVRRTVHRGPWLPAGDRP